MWLMILGVDEVGRGAWAGPLVVGAVVLGGAEIAGLTDSKALTKKRREELCEEISAKASGTGLGWVSAAEIDEIGLGPALFLATKRAVKEVKVPFHEVVIDGTVNFLKGTPLEGYATTMKKADLLVPSVSAASILAKVARDRYMLEQDEYYPEYKFGAHVGYGTAVHRQAIEAYGVTPLHRCSFAPLQQYAHHVAATSEKKARGEAGATKTTRLIGDESETVAANELVRRGHTVLERNWKTKYCEIDIISAKGGVIYFTEVKHRRNSTGGDGFMAITPKKLNQMRFAAKLYAHTNKIKDTDLRLLAIATSGDSPIFTDAIEIR